MLYYFDFRTWFTLIRLASREPNPRQRRGLMKLLLLIVPLRALAHAVFFFLDGILFPGLGTTVEPFYYLIGEHDVHFYNNEIFKPFRGKGLNPPLIEYVLFQMKERELVRAYIETSQRNIAEQRSLSKTSFRPVGRAIKFNLGKKNITLWSNSK